MKKSPIDAVPFGKNRRFFWHTAIEKPLVARVDALRTKRRETKEQALRRMCELYLSLGRLR